MVQVGSAAGVPTGFRFVEWGSVIAGAVMAAALSFVFLTFGSAIGLSAVSPWPDAGVSAKTAASLAVFWTLAQQIGAFMVGGYIAGRMRTRWAEANADETEFRDGLHGALVWAVGIVIGALLFLSTAGAIAKTGADAVAKAATVAGANAELRLLLRRCVDASGTATRSPDSAGDDTRRAGYAPAPGSAWRNCSHRLALGAAGSLTDSDRSYLATLVAQRTGLPQAEAERRVTETINEATRTAREAADKARHAAILGGLVTAVSLLLSLAAAWWAAQKGGNHRDNRIPARFVVSAPMHRPPT